MISKLNKALNNFRSGFNCGQAVLSAFCEKYDLEMDIALKLASGLGSGFRSGEVCGVASGAVLVIGLKYGQSRSEDIEIKQFCYLKTEEFLDTFRKQNGSILCRDLLGCDISTDEGREKAKNENLFQVICEEKIKNAVELLEDLGY